MPEGGTERLQVTFLQVRWPDHKKVVSRDPAFAVEMILKPLRLGPTEPFILAVDGPQGLADLGRTQRACEQILGTPGRTPSELPPDAEGAPFQGYIRSSIDLFAALVDATDTACYLTGLKGSSRSDANLFEVFPGAEWVVLAGKRLARKTTVAGRKERRQLFHLLGLVFPAEFSLPTADQNDALVGSFLAWCLRHEPDAVVQVGDAPTSLDGQIREGFILHATEKASVSPLVAALQKPAAPTPEVDVPLPEQLANEPGDDWNDDQDLLLFLTDYGLVHGSEPENAWLDTGVNYTLKTINGPTPS